MNFLHKNISVKIVEDLSDIFLILRRLRRFRQTGIMTKLKLFLNIRG